MNNLRGGFQHSIKPSRLRQIIRPSVSSGETVTTQSPRPLGSFDDVFVDEVT
jgi:hypothetical protein